MAQIQKGFKQAVDGGVDFLISQTLGLKLEQGKYLGKGFYGASIPVIFDSGEWAFYLFFKPAHLKIFAELLLETSELSPADLPDLCREIANQIIGKTKNILNEAEPNKFKLGTPEFLGQTEFKLALNERFIYKLAGQTFYIGYKKV